MHLALLPILLPLVSAHFILQYPPSLGFDDDTEAQSPCGGVPIMFNATTNLTMNGFAAAMLSTHPQANWLFRITNQTSAPYDQWMNLENVVSQNGMGEFCLPYLKVPDAEQSGLMGKMGLLQVIQSAADGELFQCAAVTFVSGANTTVGSACTNATGVTATVTDQTMLTNSTTSSSSTSASASATHASGANAVKIGSGVLGGLLAIYAALL